MTKNISIFFHIYSFLFVTFKYLIVWTYPFCDSLMYFIVFLLYILYNTFMKFLANLKNKFSMNLIGISGEILLFYYFLVVFAGEAHENSFYGLLLIELIFIVQIIVLFSIILWGVEEIFDLKIKNKFILENKIYNIFWIIGMCVSLFLTSCTIVLFFVDLLN